MEKKTKIIFIIIFILLGISSVLFLTSNLSLRSELKETYIKKEREIKKEVSSRTIDVKKAIKRDLEERYRADQISYRAMAKRLELEKEKRKELEDRLDNKVQKEESE